jgi:hypothetical protein
MKKNNPYIYKADKKQLINKKVINLNERESSLFDRATEMNSHNIKYFLPNKQMECKENIDVGM